VVAAFTPVLIFAFMVFLDLPTAVIFLVFALITLVMPALFHRLNSTASLAFRRAQVGMGADFLDSIRDILSSALEAHLAVVSNRLNEIMKSLTSWAAIILIPTLIAGLYGMNFANMPELHWRFGYLYALGVMFGSMFLLYRAFKRRGWL
jgi:ABC-type transport system involved in cytochrome bd biosynthesis fused ATPase/permease subunit